MSESLALIIVAAIGAIATTVVGMMNLIQGRKTQEQSVTTHETVNHKMDMLLKLTEEAGIARGREQEREKNENLAKAATLAKLEVEAELKSAAPPVP